MPNRKHRNSMFHFALLLWAIIIILAVVETVFHAIGWIIASLILAILAYRAGKLNGAARVNRLRTNARYGLRGPVVDLDAVSPYPPGFTETDDPAMTTLRPGAWIPDEVRDQIINDLLSGARPLRRKGDEI